MFLINLCIALPGLYITYIISHFTGGSERACEAFSFLFHYFVLVSCLALSMVTFFFGWTPFTGKKKLVSYVAAILLNWSKFFGRLITELLLMTLGAVSSVFYYEVSDTTVYKLAHKAVEEWQLSHYHQNVNLWYHDG